MAKFAIQYLDHEEGSAARWHNVVGAIFDHKDDARRRVAEYRANDEIDEYLYSYRVTEIGSPRYYSQPTDDLEW